MNQVELYCAKYGISRDVVEKWMEVYDTYRPKLVPNRKEPKDILDFLKEYYTLRPVQSEYAIEYVKDMAVKDNYILMQNIEEEKLQIEVFQVEEDGAGKLLYDLQESEHKQQMELLGKIKQGFQDYDFSSQPIIVGVEHESGYIMVEGSQLLYDRIIMERGLDEEELGNVYLVVDYVETMLKHGREI